MNWEKRGLIFNADKNYEWMDSAAMIPTPVLLDDSIIRIFLTFLDTKGISRTGYVDVNKNDPSTIINISKEPIFDIGIPGTFDENGCLTCSVTKTPDNKYYFYYAGFELGTKIRYRLLSGLAITDENFKLEKRFSAPVLERSEEELFFRGGPFCLFHEGIYKMWYVSGSDWMDIEGKSMPVYEISYLESNDGISWDNKGLKCIEIQHENEHGFGRPYVIIHEGIYKMFYSIRVKKLGYRLGYAESKDGKSWVRKDNLINLDISKDGFDNDTICYSSVIEVDGKLIMFYNGNGFGKTGLGYAELV